MSGPTVSSIVPFKCSYVLSWVVRYEDYYYMTYTTNDNITLLRSKILTYARSLAEGMLWGDTAF